MTAGAVAAGVVFLTVVGLTWAGRLNYQYCISTLSSNFCKGVSTLRLCSKMDCATGEATVTFAKVDSSYWPSNCTILSSTRVQPIKLSEVLGNFIFNLILLPLLQYLYVIHDICPNQIINIVPAWWASKWHFPSVAWLEKKAVVVPWEKRYIIVVEHYVMCYHWDKHLGCQFFLVGPFRLLHFFYLRPSFRHESITLTNLTISEERESHKFYPQQIKSDKSPLHLLKL